MGGGRRLVKPTPQHGTFFATISATQVRVSNDSIADHYQKQKAKQNIKTKCLSL
jgi:hypothetical protein